MSIPFPQIGGGAPQNYTPPMGFGTVFNPTKKVKPAYKVHMVNGRQVTTYRKYDMYVIKVAKKGQPDTAETHKLLQAAASYLPRGAYVVSTNIFRIYYAKTHTTKDPNTFIKTTTKNTGRIGSAKALPSVMGTRVYKIGPRKYGKAGGPRGNTEAAQKRIDDGRKTAQAHGHFVSNPDGKAATAAAAKAKSDAYKEKVRLRKEANANKVKGSNNPLLKLAATGPKGHKKD